MRNSFLNGNTGKSGAIKQQIMRLCINDGDFSIAEMSKETGISIPTVTKMVTDLIDEGFLEELGKSGTTGGRRPSIFGLNPGAGYFIGADVTRHHVNIAACNFKGNILE